MNIFFQAGIGMLLGTASLFSQITPTQEFTQHRAPPTPPPVIFRESVSRPSPVLQGPPTLYSIGNPSDEEQLYLEYMNRARGNPTAEGIRLRDTTVANVLSSYAFYAVDLNLMAAQLATIPPTPPLSMNAQLTAAARGHSQDMLTNDFQGHIGFFDNSTLADRASASGYNNYSSLGENVYSYAKDVFYGHAGFEVDWGAGPGGMQSPPGHRLNIHSASFREVGVGVVDGSNTNVGPQLVTQDFGAQQSPLPFITGVAYYDLNTNSFYDLAEGIASITVSVSGANFFAVTTNSGGYSVPVPVNGTYTVTFSGTNFTNFQQTVVVSNSGNVKVDFVPAYTPPAVAGPDPVFVNQAAGFSFNAVGGASSYQWKQARLAPFSLIEGAESGLTTNVTATVSAGYSVITNVAASGARSFHLAHPQAAAQYLTLNRSLRANTNSQLVFASRLGLATATEIARAQVSSDGGATWQDVWSRPGTDSSGQATFVRVTNSLSVFAGKEIHVRFAYDVSGLHYIQTDPAVGWLIDDIQFTNTDELLNQIVTVTSVNAFNFTPATNGVYMLTAAAQVSGHFLSYGPAKLVNTQMAVKVNRVTMLAGNQIQLDFQLLGGATPTGFRLESATVLISTNNVWTLDNSAIIQTNAPGQYRATTSTGGAARKFYRLRILP